MKSYSISDDDLCSDCGNLAYDPGNMSTCKVQVNDKWPCKWNRYGYAISCPKFKKCEPGSNWVKGGKQDE